MTKIHSLRITSNRRALKGGFNLDTLIKKILNIENIAQNIINEAEAEEKNIEDKLVDEIKQLEEDIVKKQNRKIEQLKERELNEARLEADKNNENIDNKLHNMESISNANMQRWINEVVTSIIER